MQRCDRAVPVTAGNDDSANPQTGTCTLTVNVAVVATIAVLVRLDSASDDFIVFPSLGTPVRVPH